MNIQNTARPSGVAEAHAQTLRDVCDTGGRVEATESARGPSSEILGYQTGMASPRRRIVQSKDVGQNVIGSVARFVWLIAGSDRLEDIAYYEDRVRPYTDNGLTVPGSSYGRRLFNGAPGLDQINGVVKSLKADPFSRRAAAVVWLPEDAVRESNDIPCTFGLFFHIREEQLHMTTIMRSNNAITLLTYNFFEFSMIGEMVAVSVGVPFGSYTHWAASMHVFDSEKPRVDAILDDKTRNSIEMPPMPVVDPRECAQTLAQLEGKLRHASTYVEIEAIAKVAKDSLPPYWLALFRVLHSFGLAKREFFREAIEVVEQLPDYLQSGTRRQIEKLSGLRDGESVEIGLFSLEDLAMDSSAAVAVMVADAQMDSDRDAVRVARALAQLDVPGGAATVQEFIDVMSELAITREQLGLAARSAQLGSSSLNPTVINTKAIEAALRRVRSKAS